MEFDEITLTLSLDKTYFVEPEDEGDTGERRQNAFFRNGRIALTDTTIITDEIKEHLHHQLDSIISSARSYQ